MSDGVLRKSDLLRNATHTEDVEIGDLGTVRLRPLSDGEWEQVEAAMVDGLSMGAGLSDLGLDGDSDPGDIVDALSGRFTIDMAAAVRGETRAHQIAAAFGLSCDGDKWTPAETARLPRGVPEKIAQEVYRLTGVEGPGRTGGRFRERAAVRADG